MIQKAYIYIMRVTSNHFSLTGKTIKNKSKSSNLMVVRDRAKDLSHGMKQEFHSLADNTTRVSRYIADKLAFSCLLLVTGTTASAHHSFAPHFDRDKPVTIAGIVTEYEQRNPHAYINIRAEDADGRLTDWRCESHGYTQLSRNGITPDMLAAGTRVAVSGSQHRRDPNMCFFDVVYLEDGRELSVNGPRGQNNAPPEEQRDSLLGTWMLQPGGFATSGPQFMMEFVTAEGRAVIEQYNPFTDDPTYRCEPVAIRRVWGAPGTPLAISQDGDNIVIRHEWMDAQRLIHMNQDAVPAGTEPSILGYARGYFDDDVLVIETSHFTQGVLNQFVTVEGEPMRGLLHSDQLRTVERLSLDQASNRMIMSMDHYDPAFFTRDFPNYTREYGPSNLDIQPFGCIPEMLK